MHNSRTLPSTSPFSLRIIHVLAYDPGDPGKAHLGLAQRICVYVWVGRGRTWSRRECYSKMTSSTLVLVLAVRAVKPKPKPKKDDNLGYAFIWEVKTMSR